MRSPWPHRSLRARRVCEPDALWVEGARELLAVAESDLCVAGDDRRRAICLAWTESGPIGMDNMPQRDSTNGNHLFTRPSCRGPDFPARGGQRIPCLDRRLAGARLVGLPGHRGAAVRLGARDRL